MRMHRARLIRGMRRVVVNQTLPASTNSLRSKYHFFMSSLLVIAFQTFSMGALYDLSMTNGVFVTAAPFSVFVFVIRACILPFAQVVCSFRRVCSMRRSGTSHMIATSI